MGKKGKNFFAFFKNRKMTPKERNEAAMEKARAISDKMAQDKQDSRNLFLEKIIPEPRNPIAVTVPAAILDGSSRTY